MAEMCTASDRSGVQEIKPLLNALPPELYEVARAYKVRAIRQ
jgi:hypothetical protein